MRPRLRIARLALLLVLAADCLAQPVPLTIWQKEHRYRPEQGQTIRLQRGRFTLLLPLADGEFVGVAAMGCPLPNPLKAFEEGTGMAGPYDGLYLTPQAHHAFYLDKSETEFLRTEEWDPKSGLRYWKATRLYDNTDSPPVEIPWEKAPNLTFVVHKEGFDDLIFYIVWQ